MATEHDDQHLKFTALYIGVVVDNVDPEKLGRVRVRIPGIIDQASAWAHPLGWPGAGASKRGAFRPLPKGSEVGVFFHQGDIDHPFYIAGFPGRGEGPEEADDSTPEEATKVQVMHEGERYRFVVDERPGKFQFQLRDKKTGDEVAFDGVKLGIHIKGTSAVSIESAGSVDISGLAVTINGRQVTKNGKPI